MRVTSVNTDVMRDSGGKNTTARARQKAGPATQRSKGTERHRRIKEADK